MKPSPTIRTQRLDVLVIILVACRINLCQCQKVTAQLTESPARSCHANLKTACHCGLTVTRLRKPVTSKPLPENGESGRTAESGRRHASRKCHLANLSNCAITEKLQLDHDSLR
jgi:hypothetical protein